MNREEENVVRKLREMGCSREMCNEIVKNPKGGALKYAKILLRQDGKDYERMGRVPK